MLLHQTLTSMKSFILSPFPNKHRYGLEELLNFKAQGMNFKTTNTFTETLHLTFRSHLSSTMKTLLHDKKKIDTTTNVIKQSWGLKLQIPQKLKISFCVISNNKAASSHQLLLMYLTQISVQLFVHGYLFSRLAEKRQRFHAYANIAQCPNILRSFKLLNFLNCLAILNRPLLIRNRQTEKKYCKVTFPMVQQCSRREIYCTNQQPPQRGGAVPGPV